MRDKVSSEDYLAVNAVRCTGSLTLVNLRVGLLEIGPQQVDGPPGAMWPSFAVDIGKDLDLRGVTIEPSRGRRARISLSSTAVWGMIDARDSNFDELCFSGDGSLPNAKDLVLAGRVVLDRIRVARDVTLVGLSAHELSMKDARIENGALLFFKPGNGKDGPAARLYGETDLAGLRAGRLAVTMKCLSTTGKIALDLTRARIDWFQYGGSGLLPRPLRLLGATVGLIEATSEEKRKLSLAAYTPELDGVLLSRLSRELEEAGRPELSDQVLRTLRQRQLAEDRERCTTEGRRGRALWLWLVDRLWCWLLDYGAQPLRPLVVSAVLCLGLVAVFLDPQNVAPSTAALIIRQEAYQPAQSGPHKDDHPLDWTAWNAAWMAAGRAFPAIDIHVEGDWQPSSTPGVTVFGRHLFGSAERWAAAVGMLNLLLVPVAILAVGRRALIRFKD